MLATLFFIGITSFVFYRVYKSIFWIRRNIFLGKKETITGDIGTRIKNVLLVALGQRKMFKLWLPAMLHLFIYIAFVITQIELIEILIDGLFHQHRIFARPLGVFYTFIISFIEILSVLAFIATLAFLWRRNVAKLNRFTKPEMKAWPTLDANLILLGELLLIIGIFTMNGSDTILQSIDPSHYADTGNLAISSWLGPVLFGAFSESSLHVLERSGWWLHYLVVLSFLIYLPYSKHLHILLAFPQTYFSKINPRGEMSNMPVVMNEVKSMLGIIPENASSNENIEMPEFGAKDIFDLSWRTILGAYSCTECGRCTAVCPANITGKKLSPRKIMMDIRDRTEEIGRNIDTTLITLENYEDGKNLFSYISPEEIHACTACQACVEACPILINPLEPILEMRRYEILTESKGPVNWLSMFNSLENNGCVWPMSESRSKWMET